MYKLIWGPKYIGTDLVPSNPQYSGIVTTTNDLHCQLSQTSSVRSRRHITHMGPTKMGAGQLQVLTSSA